MDYLGAINLMGSGVQGQSGRKILEGIAPEIPNVIDQEWCASHAAAIDAWLVNTEGTCVEEGKRMFIAIQPIMDKRTVRRLRMMATDCHGSFPDCSYRAIHTLADRFNKHRKTANNLYLDRVSMRLAEMCRLYALQIKGLLARHKQFVKSVDKTLLKQYLEGKLSQEDREKLATLLGVGEDVLDKTMSLYCSRAQDTMWVLKGDPI